MASSFRYCTNAPMVDSLLREVGLAGGGDLAQLLNGVASLHQPTPYAPRLAGASPSAGERDPDRA